MSELDLTEYNDQQLNGLSILIQGEQTKRSNATKLPMQIEELSRQYVELTGETQPPIDAATRGVETVPQNDID